MTFAPFCFGNNTYSAVKNVLQQRLLRPGEPAQINKSAWEECRRWQATRRGCNLGGCTLVLPAHLEDEEVLCSFSFISWCCPAINNEGRCNEGEVASGDGIESRVPAL